MTSDRARKRFDIGASSDAFRLDEKWYEIWRDVTPEVVEYFRPYTWVVFPVHIRHVSTAAHLVPWHQDAAYIALMARQHQRVVTCFVPVEFTPLAGSTLEFAEGEFPLLSHQPDGNHGAGIEGSGFHNVIRYELQYGDAIVFGDHVPHRTVPAMNGVIERRSFEYRLVRPDEALWDKDYFDLETRSFVRKTGVAPT